MALVKASEDAVIKPEKVAPALDTSNWPLLLKNWDQCESTVFFLPAPPRDEL